MTFLLLLSALSLSGIAAWYAIAGLMAIFAAMPIPIMIMGGALEAAKLVVASWIYNNWKRIPFLMKTYFSVALVVLMLLTSMGIFGFLSKAHLDQTMDTGGNTLQIQLIDSKIEREQKRIDDANTVLGQLDQAVQVLLDADRIRGKSGAIAVRESQKEERQSLTGIVEEASDTIANLKQEKLSLDQQKLELEAEVGPVKYIAALIYGEEESKSMLEEAVRWVILMIVFVFDPLAVLMVMAASREIAGKRKETEPVIEREPEPQPSPSSPTPTQTHHHEIKLEDSISTEDNIDGEESFTPRKEGRYLTETKKGNRTKAFLNNVGGSGVGIGVIESEIQDLQSDLPFSIDDNAK